MKICMLLGSNAGLIGLLTARSLANIKSIVSYSHNIGLSPLNDEPDIDALAMYLNIPFYRSIHDTQFKEDVKDCDMLLSIHGREIVPEELLSKKCVNIHPGFVYYKGTSPIKRALAHKRNVIDLTAHEMTEELDNGKVLFQEWIYINECLTEIEVYNKLYPYYAKLVIKLLEGV
jgi:methionyl-tRNA formyltransferase